MNVYMSEQEQIQLVKDWWKKYGKITLVSIAAAIAVSFSWRYLQQQHVIHAGQASIIYEHMLFDEDSHQHDDAQLLAGHLIKDYPSTPYASFASLFLARDAVAQNKLNEAKQRLAWVVQHSSQRVLRDIALFRLARVLVAMNQSDEALKIVNSIDEHAFLPAASSVRGDIYAAMGKAEEARRAYQIALAGLPADSPGRSLLMMKAAE